MTTATATTCSHCRTALTVDDPRSLGVCEACYRDVIDRTERRGRYARRTAPRSYRHPDCRYCQRYAHACGRHTAPVPCPVCHSDAPGLHFHVRVGTEIPARFTRCPEEES